MTYIALLRGINVGGNNKIDMKLLKKTFCGLGFKNVVTYINSGNIVFKAEKAKNKTLESQINNAIQKDFGLTIEVVVRGVDQISAIMAKIPKGLKNDSETKCDVLFLYDEIDTPEILNQLPCQEGVDDFTYIPGIVLSIIERKNQSKSKLKLLQGNKLYKKMTVRNINTVKKIFELMLG